MANSLPAGLIGQPSHATASQWHLQCLETSTGCRRQYHARWLRHAKAPDKSEYLPLVSVVIPVYNRASMVVEAVDSCLRQSYPAIEVIVVDDGSTDRLDETLRPYIDRIRVLKQGNRGVAAARNAGIQAAKGEFIQFLDSDNLLYRRCIDLKIQAFRAIPDAELCYSTYDEVDARGRPRTPGNPPPTGDRSCATVNLMNATCSGYPFIVSTVMLPRWVCRELGGFDEDLMTDEDRRYWFRLGCRGTKAIGYECPLVLRRRTLDSLTINKSKTDWSRHMVALRNVLDLVRETAHWCYVPQGFRRILSRKTMLGRDPRVMSLRAELESEFANLGDRDSQGQLSPLPILLECRLALDEMIWMFWKQPRQGGNFPQRLARTLDCCTRNARGMTRSDEIYWNGCHDLPGHGPLPAMLRELANLSSENDIDRGLSTLTEMIRGWSFDGKISRWYAYPVLLRTYFLADAGRRGIRVGLVALVGLVGTGRQQYRRWRALRARLADRMYANRARAFFASRRKLHWQADSRPAATRRVLPRERR